MTDVKAGTEFTWLQTERLILRPHAESDIPALLPLIGAREVAATTLRIPHPYSESDARDLITHASEELRKGTGLRLAMIRKEGNELCGGIGLRIDPDHHHAEIGFWIGVPFWRKGYATEAALAVVEHGFTTLKLHRIYATHYTSNPRSGHVLRKIGMRHEGMLRAHILKWGEYLDVELYGMVASDARPSR